MYKRIPLPKSYKKFLHEGYNPFEFFYNWVIESTMTSTERLLFGNPNKGNSLDNRLYYLKQLLDNNKTIDVSKIVASDKFIKKLKSEFSIFHTKKSWNQKIIQSSFAFANLDLGPRLMVEDDNLDENYIYIFPGFIKDK